MRISKRYVIYASIDKVWEFVASIENMARCMQDVEEVKVEDDKLFAKVKPRFSFIKGVTKVEAMIIDAKSNEQLIVSIRGKSIGASFEADMKIDLEYDDATILDIDLDLDLHGLLKHIPRSLIYKVVDDIGSDMLKCIERNIEG